MIGTIWFVIKMINDYSGTKRGTKEDEICSLSACELFPPLKYFSSPLNIPRRHEEA